MEFMSKWKFLSLYLLNLATVSPGVLASFDYNWYDFVHTDYGFPFVWATHTTVTIVGAVDKWSVSLANLTLNIAIWISVSFLAFFLFLWMARRYTETL